MRKNPYFLTSQTFPPVLSELNSWRNDREKTNELSCGLGVFYYPFDDRSQQELQHKNYSHQNLVFDETF